MNTFEKGLGSITDKMAKVAMVAIVACVTLVVCDVILRRFVTGGIEGTSEIVELISAVILSMGIPYLTLVKGHVAVGILVDRLRPRTQTIFDLANGVIALGFTVWLTEAMVKYSINRLRDHAVTGLYQIPLYPFSFVISLALALTSVVLIIDIVRAVILLRTGVER